MTETPTDASATGAATATARRASTAVDEIRIAALEEPTLLVDDVRAVARPLTP